MIIGSEQENDFPRLHRCLLRLEGAARDNPETVATILDLVLEMGSAESESRHTRKIVESRLWRALRYGEKPAVMVMEAPGACSQYLPGTNRIVLERSLVQHLEELETDALNKRFLRQEVVGVLLQELAQWLCYRSMVDFAAPMVALKNLADLRKTVLPGV